MNIIQPPAEWNGSTPSVFLAGGISNCPDWQAEMIRLLSDFPGTILNPRRSLYLHDSAEVATEQIEWEHRHLRRASAILFWFPCETLCPITLYEFGTWTVSSKPLFIGVHPDYQRKLDVVVQTKLVRPELEIVDSLPKLSEQVKQNFRATCSTLAN